MLKTLFTLCRESVELPRTNCGKKYTEYYAGITLDAQSDHYPEEIKRSENLDELLKTLNSNSCQPYIEAKSGRFTVYVEYYVEEAVYTCEDESEGWLFLEGSSYYLREADNEPASRNKENL